MPYICTTTKNQCTDSTDERLAALERDAGKIKIDVAAIKGRLDAELPHIATKADVGHTGH